MKKPIICLSAALLSVSLLAGCTANTVRTQNARTNNLGTYRPLATANPGTTTTTPGTTTTTPGTTTTTPGTTTTAPTTGASKFNDVPSTEWYASYINWGADLGVIDGYPDGSFKPENPLKRSELIKILKALADGGYIKAPAGTTTPGGTTTTPGGTTTTPGGTTTTPGGTTTTPGGTTTTPGGTTTTTPGGTTTTTPGGTTTTPGGTTTTPGGTTTTPGAATTP